MTNTIVVGIDTTTATTHAWTGETSSTPLAMSDDHFIAAGPMMPAVIPEDDVFFWTADWQAGEREAEADIAAGRVRRFESADELIRDLYRVRDEE